MSRTVFYYCFILPNGISPIFFSIYFVIVKRKLGEVSKSDLFFYAIWNFFLSGGYTLVTLFLCAIFFGFSGDVSIWVFLVPWLISSFCLVRTIQHLNFFKNSTDDFLRWHGFPIFFVFQFFVTASWFGPLIYVFFVEYQISHRKYLAARNLSLEEQKAEYEIKQRLFNSKKDEFEKKVRIKGSDDDRERDFLIQFPSANLRRAPRNARDFELIAESWMKFWGQFDAQVTQYSQDGGLDVVSGDFAAQVKFYADKPVGRPEVQQLYGAAIGENKKPVFFAYSNGYSAEALEWARDKGVACFTFLPSDEVSSTFTMQADTELAAELVLNEIGSNYAEWAELKALEKELEQLKETFRIIDWQV